MAGPKISSDFLWGLVETAALQHFEVVQAKQKLTDAEFRSACCCLTPKDGASSWQAMKATLEGLGYHRDAGDCWQKLGLIPSPNSAASELALDQRVTVARTLLQAMTETQLPQNELDEINATLQALSTARCLCLEQLSTLSRAKAKEAKHCCPRWGEAGESLIDRLIFLGSGKLATQLSQVQLICDAPEVLATKAAREFTTAMSLDPKGALDKLEFPKVVCWAPMDASTVGRWMNGYVQHAAEALSPKVLSLLIPLDTLPGASSVSCIMDLWTHPVLNEKYKAIVRQVRFTDQPFQIIEPKNGTADP